MSELLVSAEYCVDSCKGKRHEGGQRNRRGFRVIHFLFLSLNRNRVTGEDVMGKGDGALTEGEYAFGER